MNYYAIAFALLMLVGCSSTQEANKAEINTTLDNWHEAAAQADFESYFSYFADDSAVFMGTDASERWTIGEFKPWAKPYFDEGRAWDFTPVERHVYFSENGKTAWFDEALDTPNLGPARGSGVLVNKNGNWKIAHYNLSIPIPNSIANSVIQQIEEALLDTTSR